MTAEILRFKIYFVFIAFRIVCSLILISFNKTNMNRIALFLVATLAVSMLSGCQWLPFGGEKVAPVDENEMVEPVTETSTATVKIEEPKEEVASSKASIEIIGAEDAPDKPLDEESGDAPEASDEVNGGEPAEVTE